MSKLTYEGIAFRQNQNAPIQFVFVTSTAELDRWSKVPTRLSNRPHGFQRASIPSHIKEIKNFFLDDESKTNSSPTNILIGIAPDKRNIIELQDTDGKQIEQNTIGRKPVRCRIALDFTPWDPAAFGDSLDEEIAVLYTQVKEIYICRMLRKPLPLKRVRKMIRPKMLKKR